jgi:hypothetical protein
MWYHAIRFKVWDDFVHGLNQAADLGVVECQSGMIIVVSSMHLSLINEAEYRMTTDPFRYFKELQKNLQKIRGDIQF